MGTTRNRVLSNCFNDMINQWKQLLYSIWDSNSCSLAFLIEALFQSIGLTFTDPISNDFDPSVIFVFTVLS